MKVDARISTLSNPSDCLVLDIRSFFWQQWQQHQETLYRCCIKWMGGNLTEAEDALSQAMLKAWEKVQKSVGKIENWKAWLLTLTRNLCIDIHRKYRRCANQVEDIEGYALSEETEWLQSEDTPLGALKSDEKKMVIRHAVENLPTRLRETFVLHFYQERSYQEIVQQQEISLPNVYKRISQARKILREELKRYFLGKDETEAEREVGSNSLLEPSQNAHSARSSSVVRDSAVRDSAVSPLQKSTSNPDGVRVKSEVLEMSVEEESHMGVEAIAKETVTPPVAISVAVEEAETGQPHQHYTKQGQIPFPSTDGGSKVYLRQSWEGTVGELPQEETQQVQHSESESIAVAATDGETSEGKLVICLARLQRCWSMKNLANPRSSEISIQPIQLDRRVLSVCSRNTYLHPP